MRIRRSDEEVEIHRGANHVCVAAGGLRDAGSGCVPAARGQRSYVLHLEEEVRQPGCERAAPAQAVARRECTLEAPGGLRNGQTLAQMCRKTGPTSRFHLQ